MPCRAVVASVLLGLSAPILASRFDNEDGHYVLTALPDAAAEAQRMDRMQLCDQQPAGLYVRKGETLRIMVDELPPDTALSLMVGFRPMWNVAQDQQEESLDDGETRFTADQNGPVFFKFTSDDGDTAQTVEIKLAGGRPLPLYVEGQMTADDWADELAAHADAAFVQLLGDQALITLPMSVYKKSPIADPAASFAAINAVLDLENELAGFDGQTDADQPTALRLHYLVDFRVGKKDRESFYMYATDQFIGMLDDNTADLTDPQKLRTQWAIWHETGHTQQQSWTWEALGEINVNLFSLYVQQSFGQESTLSRSEDGEPSFLQQARDYLEQGPPDYLSEVESEDGEIFFIRLVMFHQLQAEFGWELYKDLHKHFRAHPMAEDASDQDRADAFVQTLCALTGVDLREFFQTWGLQISESADAAITQMDYSPPEQDLAAIFD